MGAERKLFNEEVECSPAVEQMSKHLGVVGKFSSHKCSVCIVYSMECCMQNNGMRVGG